MSGKAESLGLEIINRYSALYSSEDEFDPHGVMDAFRDLYDSALDYLGMLACGVIDRVVADEGVSCNDSIVNELDIIRRFLTDGGYMAVLLLITLESTNRFIDEATQDPADRVDAEFSVISKVASDAVRDLLALYDAEKDMGG